ncbi:hypothetical protein GCM10020221_05520 [Streptomyces thioluteus]|uniref:Uncharacterized protein n=1 Tax=Streptomyces thioluteus TaxID=66431 RepID=A0ABN3WE14_STRTU
MAAPHHAAVAHGFTARGAPAPRPPAGHPRITGPSHSERGDGPSATTSHIVSRQSVSPEYAPETGTAERPCPS